jgi:sterol desaturase/sphingolipid hydroxylase (fatty acid hydroxylase superfamily)
MKQVLAVGGPIVGNFVAWTLISMLPVHPIIIFALVIMSGVLMIWAMTHFQKTMDKDPSTQSQS